MFKKQVIMSNIDVIIPLDKRHKFTRGVLDDIANNSVLPGHVYLIDNSEAPETEPICREMAKRLPVVYCEQKTNIGVNASWNLGISMSSADIVAILNNDLALCSFFFEKVLATFERYKNVGLVVPACVRSAHMARIAKDNGQVRIQPMPYGHQGFAMMVKRDLVDVDKPIPAELKTFCGENWLYALVRKAERENVKCLDLPVHHFHGGISYRTRMTPLGRQQLHSELSMWREVEKRLA